MAGQDEYFIRHFDLDVVNISLQLHQKFEGDVGCVVWDAAIVLAKYLEKLYQKNHLDFRNLNVIELGSGIGCVGLTAACLGAKVLLTDLPDILPLIRKNIEINKTELQINNGIATASPLNWGQFTRFNHTPNLILLADCIYYKEAVEPLVTTLKTLASPFTKILMAQEMRESSIQKLCWDYFLELVQPFFKIKVVPLEHQNVQFRSSDIVLLELILK